MVDKGSWGRAAVRKYWLAQDIARNLSLKKITDVEMVDGDMHRLIVSWNNGTKIYVNRGETDWTVNGHILPKYGYLVQGNGLASAIEKRDGVFCESTIGPSRWYCNARTFELNRPIQIEPYVKEFKYLGDRQFTWDVVWKAEESAPRDMRVFVHFYGDTTDRRNEIYFQDDHQAVPPTNEWKGTVRYSRTITVPEDAQGEYKVGFGLYDDRGRLHLTGQQVPEVGSNSFWVGTLTVKSEYDKLDISFTPRSESESHPVRMNLDAEPIDFGFAITDGAFRIQKHEDGLRLIPLPESPAFNVTLRLSAFDNYAEVSELFAQDDEGREYRVEFNQQEDMVKFRHDGKAFCYEIRF